MCCVLCFYVKRGTNGILPHSRCLLILAHSHTSVYESSSVVVVRRKFSGVSTFGAAIKHFYLIKCDVIFSFGFYLHNLFMLFVLRALLVGEGVRVCRGGGCEGDLLAGTDLHTSEWIQVVTDSARIQQPGSCLVWLRK